MALFRALSNPQATLKLEVAHRKLPEVLGSGLPIGKPAEALALRRGAIREAVIEVLAQADNALAPHEIHRRAARRLGQQVRRHTVDTCLAKVVADPATPIAKVGPARYAVHPDLAPASLGAPMDVLQGRVLAVLHAASEAMRPAEVWAAVEAEHREATSYDAVASCLARAAKHPDLPIERVKRGRYRLG